MNITCRLKSRYSAEEQAQLAFDFLLMAFKNEKPTYRLMKADCCASEVRGMTEEKLDLQVN